MKKNLLILSVLAIVFTILSCKKEDVEQIAPHISSASMTATVNGTAWSSITRITRHFKSTNIFVISGTDTDGKAIAITIRGDKKGIYTSSTSIDSLSAQVGSVWKADTAQYVSNKGTVELTEVNEVDKKISGKFSFDVINTSNLADIITISAGEFSNVKYTEENGDGEGK